MLREANCTLGLLSAALRETKQAKLLSLCAAKLLPVVILTLFWMGLKDKKCGKTNASIWWKFLKYIQANLELISFLPQTDFIAGPTWNWMIGV